MNKKQSDDIKRSESGSNNDYADSHKKSVTPRGGKAESASSLPARIADQNLINQLPKKPVNIKKNKN